MSVVVSQQIPHQPDLSRQLQIDVEFQNLIPPMSPSEKLQLEINVQEFGCLNPLVVWKGKDILLDGHNRYEICKLRRIPYNIIEIDLPDRDAAICWIANNQLGRRNITPETISYLRGKQYLYLKGNREDNLKQNLPHGKSCTSGFDDQYMDSPKGKNFTSEPDDQYMDSPKGKNFTSEFDEQHMDSPKGKNFTSESDEQYMDSPKGKSCTSGFDDQYMDSPKGKNFTSEIMGFPEESQLTNYQNLSKANVAQILAEQYKVSDRTIKNDAQFTQALDTLALFLGDDLKHSILVRNIELTKKEILSLASTARNEGKQLAQQLLDNKLNKSNIVQQIKDKHRIPNSHHVGEVCLLLPKNNPDLRGKGKCWCIVSAVNDFSCTVTTWDGEYIIKVDHLKSFEYLDSDCLSMQEISERIKKLRNNPNLEEAAIAYLEYLGEIKRPYLTPFEEKMLTFLEQELGT